MLSLTVQVILQHVCDFTHEPFDFGKQHNATVIGIPAEYPNTSVYPMSITVWSFWTYK